MRLTRQRARRPAGIMLLARSRAAWMYVALPAALLLIFLFDWVTEAAPIQHLYYVPIVLAAIWFGNRGSLLVSSAAVLLYHLANPALVNGPYKDTDLVQILLFFGIGLGAARVAHDTQRLQRLATTDDLTGLHNLRSFEARLTRYIADARRSGDALSMLVFDVDRLKSMNDEHGHLAGAEAVRAVGLVLGERLPLTACACRYGGDEFVVALPGFGPADARHIAHDIRRAVNALAPVLAGVSFPAGTLSVSVGLAGLGTAGRGTPTHAEAVDAGESLFRAADAALYQAKREGRNRVAGQDAVSAA
jgi:diguanylate cyclase (GGDEF)-like protein